MIIQELIKGRSPSANTKAVPLRHIFQSSRANSMLPYMRSPIKEENEEDEASQHETPWNSIMPNQKVY